MNAPAVTNLNAAVREWNDEVIFLRKILPGRTRRRDMAAIANQMTLFE